MASVIIYAQISSEPHYVRTISKLLAEFVIILIHFKIIKKQDTNKE